MKEETRNYTMVPKLYTTDLFKKISRRLKLPLCMILQIINAILHKIPVASQMRPVTAKRTLRPLLHVTG